MFHFIKSDQPPSAKKLAALYFYFIPVSSYKIVSRFYTALLNHSSEQDMSSPKKNSETFLPLMTSCVATLIIVKEFYGNSIYKTKWLKNWGSRYNEKILKTRLLHHRVK
jgi:hypothetical protein